uniref:Putative ovule protein n=1 Tax=Solanum chacoense TaxID=4108 RepID=A0A0V0IWV1_SOLCH
MSFLAVLSSVKEPATFKEASSCKEWVRAMQDEVNALEQNATWTVVDLPPGKKAIGSKWVYKVELQANGQVERYKARLVAKGYNQQEGLDYHETFSPVAKMVTVRTTIGVVASQDWPLYQMDVHNAFLQGDLLEDVYMEMPQGFQTQGENKVCKLLKSLYGLKQASRQWNQKLTEALLSIGYSQSSYDYSLFTKRDGEDIAVILIYVDDLLITGNSNKLIQELKDSLHSRFKMKDLGVLKFFLGIEIMRSKSGILLNQRKYALELISDTGLSGAKPVNTPLETNVKLTTVEYDELTGTTADPILKDITGYQRLVGRLLYLTITRPDISFAAQVLSQFMQHPKRSHWEAALRVVRYIKSCPGQGMLLSSKRSWNLKYSVMQTGQLVPTQGGL